MNLEFLPEADDEFREAARYYEIESPGEGFDSDCCRCPPEETTKVLEGQGETNIGT